MIKFKKTNQEVNALNTALYRILNSSEKLRKRPLHRVYRNVDIISSLIKDLAKAAKPKGNHAKYEKKKVLSIKQDFSQKDPAGNPLPLRFPDGSSGGFILADQKKWDVHDTKLRKEFGITDEFLLDKEEEMEELLEDEVEFSGVEINLSWLPEDISAEWMKGLGPFIIDDLEDKEKIDSESEKVTPIKAKKNKK